MCICVDKFTVRQPLVTKTNSYENTTSVSYKCMLLVDNNIAKNVDELSSNCIYSIPSVKNGDC